MSGHITAEDAQNAQPLMINRHAALVALDHEVREELRLKLDVHRDAKYLGQVLAVSHGTNEVCNCTTWVFSIEVADIPTVSTAEVDEVRSFEAADVKAALTNGSGLKDGDGVERDFADNFPLVFAQFLEPEDRG